LIHSRTDLPRQHFLSEHHRELFWDSLANHRYRIDWQQFGRRLYDRIDMGDAVWNGFVKRPQARRANPEE
jgi:hypothetical protein